MIDYAACWTDLAAWVAAEPNRGRQATLAKMAELASAHTVSEDELERALRLVAPHVSEVIFNRMPGLVELLGHAEELPELLRLLRARNQGGAGSPIRGAEADLPSMAVA